MKECVIVSAVRLPVGSFGGSLKTIRAIDMGAMVVKEAVKRAGLKGEQVDEVIVGQVGQVAETASWRGPLALRPACRKRPRPTQ